VKFIYIDVAIVHKVSNKRFLDLERVSYERMVSQRNHRWRSRRNWRKCRHMV